MDKSPAIPLLPVFIILLAIFTIAVTATTLPLIAGIYIVGDLGGSESIAVYMVCFYAFGNVIGIPAGRALSQRFGTVTMLFYCTFCFAICTLLCAAASNFSFLVAMRFLQGLAAGPLFILVNQLLSALGTTEQKEQFSAITGTVFIMGPPIAAAIGGWIAYDYNWRSLFYTDFFLLTTLATASWYMLRGYRPTIAIKRFDSVGFIFFSIAISCLGFALVTGQEFDWFRSNMIITLFCIGIPSLAFFIVRSFYCPHALFQIRLFKKILFTFGILNEALLFSSYFGTVILLSYWLHLYANYTPIWIGLILGLTITIGALPEILLRKWMYLLDVRFPLFFSLLLFAYSSFYTTDFNSFVNIERIGISRTMAGVALTFFLPAVARLCFGVFPTEKSLDVLAIFQSVRAWSSGLGAGLYLILFQRRQVFYYDRLGSQLTDFSYQTHAYFAKAKEIWIVNGVADAQLNVELLNRATSLALDDCFYLMGWIMVVFLVTMVLTTLLNYREGALETRVLNYFPFRKS